MSLKNIAIITLLALGIVFATRYESSPELTESMMTDYSESGSLIPEHKVKQLQQHNREIDEEVNETDTIEPLNEDHDVALLDIFSENPDIEAWVESRGYLPQEYLAEDEYDPALLHAEAIAGNMNAQQIMASHLLSQQNFDEARVWLEEAASRGSSRALLMLAQAEMTQAQNTSPIDELRMKQAKAWMLVAEKRGDPMGRIASHYFGLATSAQEEPPTDIKNLSETYYHMLSEKRLQHGLPAFSDVEFPGEDLMVFQYLEK